MFNAKIFCPSAMVKNNKLTKDLQVSCWTFIFEPRRVAEGDGRKLDGSLLHPRHGDRGLRLEKLFEVFEAVEGEADDADREDAELDDRDHHF